MKCPSCDVTLSISSREGVEIDFCPQCRGVWLDRGELDKIIDRERDDDRDHRRDRDDDRPRYDDRDRDRYDDRDRQPVPAYGKRKKKKGFLEDLFEFG